MLCTAMACPTIRSPAPATMTSVLSAPPDSTVSMVAFDGAALVKNRRFLVRDDSPAKKAHIASTSPSAATRISVLVSELRWVRFTDSGFAEVAGSVNWI